MTDLVMLSGAVFVAAFVFLIAIPWMFKTLCLYGLHSLRDTTYAYGRRLPHITKTRIYQDIVFMQTNAIHSIRDLGVIDCINTFLSRHKRLPRKADWRASSYADEIEACFTAREDREALERLVDGVSASGGLVVVRLATAHPLITLATFAVGFMAVFKWLLTLASAEADPPSGLAEKLARSWALSA